MRATAAILLLSIHLFNVAGYRVFFSIAEKTANQKTISSLDRNEYNDNDLVQIKVALHMPYIQPTSVIERYDGKIELAGIRYNYVKRLVANDTLYLFCLPDQKNARIDQAKNDFASETTSESADKNSGESSVKKASPLSEYTPSSIVLTCQKGNISFSPYDLPTDAHIQKGFSLSHLQPPDQFI